MAHPSQAALFPVPIPTPARPPSALAALGVYGFEALETPVLAAIVLGEPILFVGSHGTAKTTVCRALAGALGLEFWAYDASKALFEDVLGFPRPSSLAEGQLDYVPTPISIWGKQAVLVDELSRANPALQSKWLELIRSRRIMGHALPDLELVFAAMNPPSYLGAHPLDEALASRFMVVVRVPEAKDLSPADLRAVISNVTEDDAPAIRRAAATTTGEGLRDLIARARRRYESLGEDLKKPLVGYVAEVARTLQAREAPLDGRRLGMIHRLEMALLALVAERDGGEIDLKSSSRLLLEGLRASLPFEAMGKEVASPVIRAAHETAFAAVTGVRWARSIVLPRDPLEAVTALEEQHARASRDERRAALTKILELTEGAEGEEGMARGFVALGRLAKLVSTGALPLEPDDQFRVLDALRSHLAIEPQAVRAWAREATSPAILEGGVPLESVIGSVALRNGGRRPPTPHPYHQHHPKRVRGRRRADDEDTHALTRAVAGLLEEQRACGDGREQEKRQ